MAKSLKMNGWYGTANEQWKQKAQCGAHPDLPWTADFYPTTWEIEEMRGICSQCPVMLRCARHALGGPTLNGPKNPGVDGGFYAGVWLPWPTQDRSKHGAELRTYARAMLRRIVKAGEPKRLAKP